jgi:hypothetical protein
MRGFHPPIPHMPVFAATIALSALLLFLVQPVIAKQILPWFGGSAGVWSVCMVFFQCSLLAGYAYAHLVVSRLAPRTQFRLHVALLALSLLQLPIVPNPALKPAGGQDAALAILVVLLTTIGLPYFLLSATGPLLQAWIAHRFPARSVYRMFALSNLGSLLGLLAFPFAVEPLLGSRQQAFAWSLAYVFFASGCAWAAWRCQGRAAQRPAEPAATEGSGAHAGEGPGDAGAAWPTACLALSALGVVLLLATTNQLQQNVASVPFLWVLPLALYLFSFVFVFEGRQGQGWYARHWGLPAALLAALLMAGGLSASNGVLDVALAVPLYCLGLFAACVFCHGELAALKPAHGQLTRYYLMISTGGALGGAFVGLVAPRLFASLYELPLALILIPVAAFWAARRSRARGARAALCGLAALSAAGIAWADLRYVRFLDHDLIVMQRNFYGTLRVREVDEDGVRVRRLLHGVILHGEQPTGGPGRNQPGSYYTPTSGVGLAIARAQARAPAARIGVIGMGVGTLAAYGRRGDTVRFYELDRDVVALANSRFTYLQDTPARIEVALGDARLSLEREWTLGQRQRFDVLAVDAFSSDSIPVHLLTREAIELYARHLADDGVIAMHISNRFLDLQPVLANIAAAAGLSVRLIEDDVDESRSRASSSEWVLLARDPRALAGGDIGTRGTELRTRPGIGVWTDDSNNLLRAMKTSPLQAIERLVSSAPED